MSSELGFMVQCRRSTVSIEANQYAVSYSRIVKVIRGKKPCFYTSGNDGKARACNEEVSVDESLGLASTISIWCRCTVVEAKSPNQAPFRMQHVDGKLLVSEATLPK
jgi:hypothetical protein